jgi:hypothetical protein
MSIGCLLRPELRHARVSAGKELRCHRIQAATSNTPKAHLDERKLRDVDAHPRRPLDRELHVDGRRLLEAPQQHALVQDGGDAQLAWSESVGVGWRFGWSRLRERRGVSRSLPRRRTHSSPKIQSRSKRNRQPPTANHPPVILIPDTVAVNAASGDDPLTTTLRELVSRAILQSMAVRLGVDDG